MGKLFKKSKVLSDSKVGLQEFDETDLTSQEFERKLDDFDEQEDTEEESEVDDEDKQLDDDETQQLDFDFEALPPEAEDCDGIVDLLTQVFLRVDVNLPDLSNQIIALSPFGCVFKPVEEFDEDGDAESIVYGVVSIVPLNGSSIGPLVEFSDFRNSFSKYILQRANKHASKSLYNKLKELLSDSVNASGEFIGLLINERLLYFPAQVSGPAFQSLRDDYEKKVSDSESKQSKSGVLPKFNYFLLILKIRIADSQNKVGVQQAHSSATAGKKRKLSKAEKKRQRLAVNASTIMYDNPEEELLFEENAKNESINQDCSSDLASSTFSSCPSGASFFDFPVESDVESSSKFHRIRRDGVLFSPYRRVCLLSPDQFFVYVNRVIQSYSSAS